MAQHALAADRVGEATVAKPGGWDEDWLSVVAGFVVFALALAYLFGGNLLGWATAPRIAGAERSCAGASCCGPPASTPCRGSPRRRARAAGPRWRARS